jgi:uncharacterized membrane protein YeaQ/YmgE (transglycosylase-associated protein family)
LHLAQIASNIRVGKKDLPNKRRYPVDIVNLLISLISGVVGGNIAGAAMKEKSLGGLGNSIAGLVGGGIGGWLLSAMGVLGKAAPAVAGAAAAGGMDIGALIGNIAGSGVGGAIVMIIVGMIKGAQSKTS